MLIKIIYASQATRAMSDQDLAGLLTTARQRNSELDVSGMLLYCRQSFLQMIEGDESTVDRIYHIIETDGRHRNVRLLSRSFAPARRFPDWSMGFGVANDEDLAQVLPGFVPATRYPLVSGDMVRNAVVAETLLDLYRRNG